MSEDSSVARPHTCIAHTLSKRPTFSMMANSLCVKQRIYGILYILQTVFSLQSLIEHFAQYPECQCVIQCQEAMCLWTFLCFLLYATVYGEASFLELSLSLNVAGLHIRCQNHMSFKSSVLKIYSNHTN